MAPKLVRRISLVFVVAYLVSAVVQLNDPDPFVWIAVYGVGAMFSVLGAWRFPLQRAMAVRIAVFGLLTLIWAATNVPRVIQTKPPWDQVFSSMQMMAPGVEEAREAFGLVLIGGWMLFLAVGSFRLTPPDPSNVPERLRRRPAATAKDAPSTDEAVHGEHSSTSVEGATGDERPPE